MNTARSHLNQILIGVGIIFLGASTSHAQEFFDDQSEVLADVPVDLSGHEYAPRRRPEKEDDPDALADQPGLDDRSWFGHLSLLKWDRATGDWNGIRTELERSGLTIEGSYLYEYSSVFDGGIDDDSSHRSLLDINISLDLETYAGWNGAMIFADFYSTSGRSISADAGDFQGLSNIETGRSVDQLSELWLEQTLLDGALRMKLGKIDANSEFAFVESAGEFINSSAGFSPTILALPTYADPAIGAVVQVFPSEKLSISVGFFDGSATIDGVPTGSRGPSSFFNDELSDDYFLIGEAGYAWELGVGLPGRAAAGLW